MGIYTFPSNAPSNIDRVIQVGLDPEIFGILITTCCKKLKI
jgi:hypothetical protein